MGTTTTVAMPLKIRKRKGLCEPANNTEGKYSSNRLDAGMGDVIHVNQDQGRSGAIALLGLAASGYALMVANSIQKARGGIRRDDSGLFPARSVRDYRPIDGPSIDAPLE